MIVLTDQPQLGQFDDDHIDAWATAVRPHKYQQRIAKVDGERCAIEHALNLFIISATIVGVTRDVALVRLMDRASLVRDHLAAEQAAAEGAI